MLFLDEPTVGLDPRIRHELLDVIAGLRARSEMTILLTTHYLDEAQRLCDRVAIMNRGEIARSTPRARCWPGSAARSSSCASTATRPWRSRRCAPAASRPPTSSPSARRVTLPLRRTSAAEAIAAIHATDVRASGITTRTPTLDDVYLRLTGNRMAEAA